MDKEKTINHLKRFKKIILWGETNFNRDGTFYYIHNTMYNFFKKINIDVIWCENEKKNNELIFDRDLVFGVDISCSNLKFKKNAYFALMNGPINTNCDFEDIGKSISLRVLGSVPINADDDIWNNVTVFDKKNKILHQSWATNLLPEEFYPPIFNESSIVNYVGSVWNDRKNHGNVNEIEFFKRVLCCKGINFRHYEGVSDNDNIRLIRESRIAPSIGGKFQVEINMTPCRFWKNVSYGQLGISNIMKFKEIFGNCGVFDKNIENIVNVVMGIKSKEYKEMIIIQQDIVKNNHTYLDWWYFLCQAFDCI